MKNIVFLFMFLVLSSCSEDEANEAINQGNDGSEISANSWGIPVEEIYDGGPGKDGIPALVNPSFTDARDVNFLNDSDLVIVFKDGEEVKVYPHLILDWHEIINDNVNNTSLAVTYCPLTGTGIGWNRVVEGNETTFGVSGLLYNSNLIAFDRATDSHWPQIMSEAVKGPLKGTKADILMLLETDWKTLKEMYPDSQVVNRETGISRPYGEYPYGNYLETDILLFPVFKDDKRLPLKERVHVIPVGHHAKVYRFGNFSSNNNIIIDEFFEKNYIVAGNSNFIVSFEITNEQAGLSWQYIFDGSEALLKDSQGNTWNIFGKAISGPHSGQSLKASSSFMSYWFPLPSFYRGSVVEIYGR